MLTQTAPEGHPAGGRSDTDGPAAVEVTVAPAAEPLITECRPLGIRQIKKFAVSVPRQNGSLQEVWRWEDDTRKLREKDYKKAISRALQFFERHHGKPANKSKAIRDLTDAVKRAAAAAERHREQQRADGGPAPTNTDVMPAVGESAGTATGAEPSVLAAAVAAKDREPAGTSEIGLEADASRGARGEVVTIGRNHDGPLLPHHRKELEEGSGLSAATIAEAEFRSIPAGDPETAKLLNWKKPNPKLGAALVMPLGGTDCPAQVKFDNPREGANRKPIKYESPVGSKPDIYIPPDARDGVLTTKAPVVITEGVKKALKAVQEGILTIALLGVSMFKVKGEQRLIPGLERIDWDGREAVICYDSDGRTNRSVGQAAAELAALLEAEGAEVKVLFLPPGEGGKKVGMDDFLLAHPVEELEALIDDAGPPGSVEDAGRRNAKAEDPEDLAAAAAAALAVNGVPGAHLWHNGWSVWGGDRFAEQTDRQFRGTLLKTLKPNFVGLTGGVVTNAQMHLEADSMLPGDVREGDWLVGGPPAGWDDPLDLFPAANGLVHLPSAAAGEPCLLPHDPRRFGTWVGPVPFDPAAPEPERWLRFLHEDLFPARPDEVRLLQQLSGYALTGDTRHHLAGLLVGPRRSGKGTFLWVLEQLLGAEAVASRTLRQLGERFGRAGLHRVRLLVSPDVRLPQTRKGKTDIIELLLSLTGEDRIPIEEKGKDIISARPRVKVFLASNELPALPDPSAAVAGRFLPVGFDKSFYGAEDTGLKKALAAELPGILLWAVAGWADLRAAGRFVEPARTVELREELARLASPVRAFVEDCCVLGPGEKVPVPDLVARCNEWLALRKELPMGDSKFGSELRAAFPHLPAPKQRRIDKGKRAPGGTDRPNHYRGIGLA